MYSIVFLIFILGLLIGSFLNVCIYRIPRKESIAYPSSHCTNCSTPLKPMDLIPIFSFLFLKGRCRYCQASISIRYPLIELWTGFLFVLLFFQYDLKISLAFHMLLVSILICIFFIDYDHQLIPDSLNLFIFLIALIYHSYLYFQGSGNLWSPLGGILFGGGLFLLIALVTKGAMGGGDIKLMGALGLYFGLSKIIVITLFSFIIGSLFSLILVFLKIKSRKDYIPFGPFIVIATWIVFFFGEQIIGWYINTFFL